MVDTEKNLSLVADGGRTSFAWKEIEPIIRGQEKSVLTRLKQEFRSGASNEALRSLIAELIAVEDLENLVRVKVLQGQHAAKAIFGANGNESS